MFKRFFCFLVIQLTIFEILAADLPRVSIVTPIYKGERFISDFLKDVTRQTIFRDCELILVNGNSSEKENELIKPYIDSHPNIHLIHLKYDSTRFHVINKGIEKATGKYIYYASLDNRLNPKVLEVFANHLDKNKEVDLVYGDYLITDNPKDTFEDNVFVSYEITPEYKPYRMNLDIPGSQPMWRKSIHEKYGYFIENFTYLGKEEFFNRISSEGAFFQKVSLTSNLCYHNIEASRRTKREKKIYRFEQDEIHLNYSSHWANLTLKPNDKAFVIVIPSYNNKDWYKRNLDSVFSQKYSNYRVIYIDDASPDKTGEYVEKYIKENNLEEKVHLIRNTKRVGALANLYKAIHLCAPYEIVCTLDGDDWFSNDKVLDRLVQEYNDPDTWLTYGQFNHFLGEGIALHDGYCKALPERVINTNGFRKHFEWVTSQLRTFYAGLFHKVKKEDLMDKGEFYSMAYDVAIMLPMLEMAGKHIRFIPDVLYIYNRVTPLNDDKIDRQKQTRIDLQIRDQNIYTPLKSKELVLGRAKKKKVYISAGQWGQLFAKDHPIFDRDGCLKPLIEAKAALEKNNVELLQAYSLNNLHDADAIICFDMPNKVEREQLQKYPYEKRILFLWEPPTTSSDSSNKEYHKLFSKVFTWNDDWVDGKRYHKFFYPFMQKMTQKSNAFESKKLLVNISCNKHSSHPDELYSERLRAIKFFTEKDPKNFDLYGRGWEGAKLNTYKGTVKRKIDVMPSYKFCLCYENMKNIKGYVSEKILNAFQAGCIPIYLGASNITDYVPENCFIDRRKYSSDQELYDYISSMSKEDHEQYIKNIDMFLSSTQAAKFSEEGFIRLMQDILVKGKLPYYICTAADSKYFRCVMCLIGGLHKFHFDDLGEIAVFDLGLTDEQVNTLNSIDKVRVFPVEPTNAQMLTTANTRTWGKPVIGWYSWKPVCIKGCMDIYPDVLWIDAGTTISSSIDSVFAYMREKGYFFHNGSHWHFSQSCTSYLKDKYDLASTENKWMLSDRVKGLEAGLMGVTQSVYESFVMPMYQMSKNIKNFIDDGTALGGFGYARHDTTLFSMQALLNKMDIIQHFQNSRKPFDFEISGKKIPFHIASCPSNQLPITNIYCSRMDTSLNRVKSCIRYRLKSPI